MIIIKNKLSIAKMATAGELLASIFDEVQRIIKPGITTAEIDAFIEKQIKDRGLVSAMKGYMGYAHVSCISVNDEVVHGVPAVDKHLRDGDMLTIDVCASYKGYCADMARCFFVGTVTPDARKLVEVAQQALDQGIAQARAGNRLSDISAAIEAHVSKHGYGVVRDFAGHGIGKSMHEDPEVLNFGTPGKGPVLRAGMTLAIEPMITQGSFKVRVGADGWTVTTKDNSLAAHVEDTILITEGQPKILTRPSVGYEGRA